MGNALIQIHNNIVYLRIRGTTSQTGPSVTFNEQTLI